MIITKNKELLLEKYPHVIEALNKEARLSDGCSAVKIETAKNGEYTMVVQKGEQSFYIHSLYNPRNEALQLVEGLEGVESYKEALFFGIGLGYHIDKFMDKFPKISVSIFEPDKKIFEEYIQIRRISDWPAKFLRNIYVGLEHENEYILDFTTKLRDKVMLIVLPSYERVFEERTKQFCLKLKESVVSTRSAFMTNRQYEKLWIVNSIKNFPKVLNTTNMIREKKDCFKGKPIILVAAGPSLQDEYDNLRYIKDNALAYIFAVGSANKGLIANGILPDAMTSYDPNPWNCYVYDEVIEQNIDSIPLIFGSSVGFETVNMYPGPLLHMITSQDTISYYYLDGTELRKKGEVIGDAPSIAILTADLLARFEVSQIIFVGLNLASRLNQYYAQGVNSRLRESVYLTEAEKGDHQISVESVDGDLVMSDTGNNQIRLQMEYMIALTPQIPIINTTVGGAKIRGATFMSLKDVINQHLTEAVVDPKWYQGEPTQYNKDYIMQQISRMDFAERSYVKIIDKILQHFEKIKRYIRNKNPKSIRELTPKFDSETTALMGNDFFIVYIRPMLRNHVDIIIRTVPSIVKELNPLVQGAMVLKTFESFINDCRILHEECQFVLQELKSSIREHFSSKEAYVENI